MARTKQVLNADNFRRVVLGLAGAIEGARMGHPDFRVNGRIFASLNHDVAWAMVKLTPDEQQRFRQDYPDAFKPESGAARKGLSNPRTTGRATGKGSSR